MIIDTLIYDRTEADVNNETPKGFYNASDLNRVGEAVNYLNRQLQSKGVSTGVSGVVTSWSVSDVPTEEQLTQYLMNVSLIRNGVKRLKPNTKFDELPISMLGIDYQDANHIEHVLKQAFDAL